MAAKPPSLPEYQDGLKSDMFLYLGHGSGKEFLAGKGVTFQTINLTQNRVGFPKICLNWMHESPDSISVCRMNREM